ncbi:MAG: dehydrogenase [Candidatus Omnitrophica bacterium]|nr:dehydrogenase [Candidatus Omnitrophota bacterium]MBU4478583.1 dehydrogenase [Candidatus Omnitrophota bacterium]
MTNNKTQRKGPVVFSDIESLSGLKKALELGSDKVVDIIKESKFRGRGGAGFPTGLKWGLAAAENEQEKYVVCNADEGEPGTFKDRVLLTEYPKLLFEGMIIAAFAIGAEKGYLYLRAEYKSFLAELENELAQMRKDNLLGNNILGKEGFNFDIEILLGAGAYICGEETALIESMEGNRGEPRNRPPFPVNTGFNGHPTIVNNVETFAAAVHIISKGAEWFKSIGTKDSTGSKLLSISGDCLKPGVYEVPFGTSIKEILKMVEAKDTKAVQVGGASGTCVPKKQFNRLIAYEDLSTGGSVIIFSNKRNMLEVAKNFLEFFEEESCGQCTPCREGLPVLLEAVDALERGQCSKEYLKDVVNLTETMQIAAKCGLGQSCPNAFVSIINNFKEEYSLAKINKKEKR